jgi:glycosyltransferase involved in cell wall biosynthesis
MGKLAEAWMRDGLNREALRIATETSEASPRCTWYEPASFANFASLDAVVAPCEAVKAGLRSHFGYRGPIEIVPHWISPTTFVPRFHETGEVRPPFRLVAVSRLRIEKGIDFMVAALSLLARTHDATLDIFGENGEEQRCRELCAALGVADRVRILGPFSGDSRESDILDRAHVLLLSSLFEGLPLAIMKAIAMGRVTVATRVGGVPELLEPVDPDLVVPVGDPAAMASAVACLLDAPERLLALEKRARAHFTSNYDPATVERRHLAFYENLAEKAVSCG